MNPSSLATMLGTVPADASGAADGGDVPGPADGDRWLRTIDGVRLRARHLPGLATAPAGVAVVLAHGFTGALDNSAVARIAQRLRTWTAVLAFDFRGHGRSGGLCTLGDAEVLDVDAAVLAARTLGYDRVATVGFSMGGSAVLRHAALVGERTAHRVEAVVSISGASRWYRSETPAMRRLHWAAEHRLGRRAAARFLGTRIDPRGWPAPPAPPDALVGRIAPVPLLLVHGDRDHYLSLDNARALYDAAGEPRTLWVWEGFAHAEAAMTADRVDAVGGQVLAMLGRARVSRDQLSPGWPSPGHALEVDR